MSTVHSTPAVDVNIPRFNQAVVAAAIAIALTSDAWVLVAAVALMLTSALLFGPKANITARLYVAYLRDRVDPGGPSEVEDARPPRFALLLGAIFTSGATLAFLLGWHGVGWVLASIVGGLALLAATSRICVGCLIYERVWR